MNQTARPPLSATSSRLDDLLDDLAARIQAGESVDIEAFARDNPEHASELRRVLPAMQVLAGLPRSGDLRAAHAVSGEPLGELGDYGLIREVGRGGMGVVYEAEQVSLRRRVALKVLPWAAAMDPKQLQRFKNEALAAASLKHDHIVSVYAVGCERGVHYYAMEFIEGQTLAELIAEMQPASRERRRPENQTADFASGPLPSCGGGLGWGVEAPAAVTPTPRPSPPPQGGREKIGDTAPVAALSTKLTGNDRGRFRAVATLMADAADALEHAHSLGIVHRDIKPGNLLLGAAGRIYVSDFGLARFGPDAGLTMSGDLLGTLRYMAPEQALARHGLADHRVDVYGLGCTLYELLTGKYAVRGQDKADILGDIAFGVPVSPRRLDRALPVELETITLKCLTKNPADRYATAGELAADLRRFVEDKPIKAKPPGVSARVTRWVRRNRALAASAAVALTVVLVATAGSVGYVLSEHASRLTLTKQKAQAALTAARDSITAGDLTVAGRKISEARGQLGGDGEPLRDLAADIDRVQAEIETRLEDAARFHRFVKLADDAQDRLGFNLFDAFDGIRVAREALSIYGVLDNDNWFSQVQNSTLTAAQVQQVRDAAYLTVVSLACSTPNVFNASRSLQLLKQAEAFHEPTRALFFARAECYRHLKNVAAAEADDKLFNAARAKTPWDHYLTGRAMAAKVPQDRNDLDSAIAAYRAALAMQPNHHNALYSLAGALALEKNYAEAAGLYSACLAVGPVQGRSDVYAHRALCYRRLGQQDAAAADYATAVSVDTDSAQSLHALAAVLEGQGRIEDAVKVRRRQIELAPNAAKGHFRLAELLYIHLKQYAEAEMVFRRGLELQPNYGPGHMGLGNVLVHLGRTSDAEAAYRRPIEVDPNFANSYFNLGILLIDLGREKEAEPALRRFIELQPNDAHAHHYLGVVLHHLGRSGDAEAALRRAIELKPDYADAHQNLGVVLSNQGKHSEAAAAYRRALELKPDDPQFLNGLSWLLATGPEPSLRDPAQAVELATKAVAQVPNDGSLHNTLGVAQYRAGNWNGAVASLGKSVELRSGGDSLDWFFLAMAHWQLGDREQARKDFARAVAWMDKNRPQDAELRRFRAEAADLLGIKEPPADANPPPKP